MSTDPRHWVLAGLILFLALVLFHPLVLDALGKEHPPNCPLCAHFSNSIVLLPAIMLLPLLIFLGYFLVIPSRKLASRFSLISSGRAPPPVFLISR